MYIYILFCDLYIHIYVYTDPLWLLPIPRTFQFSGVSRELEHLNEAGRMILQRTMAKRGDKGVETRETLAAINLPRWTPPCWHMGPPRSGSLRICWREKTIHGGTIFSFGGHILPNTCVSYFCPWHQCSKIQVMSGGLISLDISLCPKIHCCLPKKLQYISALFAIFVSWAPSLVQRKCPISETL